MTNRWTPSPSGTRTSLRACVIASSLRVRSGPGTGYGLVGGLSRGDCVELDGISQDGEWVRTDSSNWQGGFHGWVAVAYLRISEPTYALPVVGSPATARPIFPTPTITRRPTATTGIITPVPRSQPETERCDPSYPTVCIPSPPPDLDCGDIPYRRFLVVGSDPHNFDGDGDGIGCER